MAGKKQETVAELKKRIEALEKENAALAEKLRLAQKYR